jgi:hypothetical protein
MPGKPDRLPGSLPVIVLVLAAAIAFEAPAADVRPMIKVGIDTGGDTLVTATFADGSTETINANQGFYVGGGVSIVNAAKNLELEISLSFKYTTAYGPSSELDWTRYPLDALVFYRWSWLRLGGGLTYHLNPQLKGNGEVSGLTTGFDNALGFVLQADYRITETFTAGVRFTSVDYKASAGPLKATGSGVGITLGMSF